ncbi:MAG: sensor histidine kinase [Leptospirales bacterium]
MIPFIRTIYGKLILVLAGLFVIIGLLTILLTFFSTRLYVDEVNQKLNLDLASHLVSDEPLLTKGQINSAALKNMFHMLMVINPSIEIYLLDPTGKILAYSATPGKVKRNHVSLSPLKTFLRGGSRLPILGDDPRGFNRNKVFSVAPIMENRQLAGYLYVILGGEDYDTVTRLLEGSYILRLSFWIGSASLLFAFIVGLILFRVITRRITLLVSEMEFFQKSDFSEEISFPEVNNKKQKDEIGRLRETFSRMSGLIRDQIRRLKESDRLRRDMVANVSHDIRTPLTSLQGYLDTLFYKGDILTPEKRKEYIEIAARQSQRLSVLVEELFELAKLDALEVVPNKELFSLVELVSDIVQKFQLKAQEKGLQIERQFTADLPFVEGDIGMIERVFENLIGNALQHTPKGGVISISLNHTNGRIHVQVKDTGHGIPPEEIPHIFLRFYRVEKDRSAESGGAGLGLAIVKRILEIHNAYIEVESIVAQGTTFKFDLPVLST